MFSIRLIQYAIGELVWLYILPGGDGGVGARFIAPWGGPFWSPAIPIKMESRPGDDLSRRVEGGVGARLWSLTH